jgi:hypothetical protein
MIEFTSNHHGMRVLEKVMKEAVRRGFADCIKDSREGEAKAEQYVNGEAKAQELREENRERSFGVVVYREYLLRISRGGIFISHEADIRIWYNEHTKMAGIKISEEALMAIGQTHTVMNFLLHQLNVELGGGKDGKLTLEKVAALLTQATSKIDPNFRNSFTAQRKE